MTIHDLTAEHADYHLERIRTLKADTVGLWGRLDATRMMAHLRSALEISLAPDESRRPLLPVWIGRPLAWLVFDVFTRWPADRRSSAPVRALFPEANHGFEEERARLLAAVERFVRRQEESPCELHVHPLAGSIPLRRWARAHAVHMNHHYRQFGLVE